MSPRTPAVLVLAVLSTTGAPTRAAAQLPAMAIERRLADELALRVGDTLRIGTATDSMRSLAIVARDLRAAPGSGPDHQGRAARAAPPPGPGHAPRRARSGGPLRRRPCPWRIGGHRRCRAREQCVRLSGVRLRLDRRGVLADLPRGEPLSSRHRGDHHRRQRRLPPLHHAAQGGGAADGRGGDALRRRAAPDDLRRPSARGRAGGRRRLGRRYRARVSRGRRHQRLLPAVLRHRPHLLAHHAGHRALQRRCSRSRSVSRPAPRRHGVWFTRGRWCSGAGDERRRLGAQEPPPPAAPDRALAGRDRGGGGHAARHGHAERRHRQVVHRAAAGPRLSDAPHPEGHPPLRHRGHDGRRVRHRRGTAPRPGGGGGRRRAGDLALRCHGRLDGDAVRLRDRARGAVALPADLGPRPRARRHVGRRAERAGRPAPPCHRGRHRDPRRPARPAGRRPPPWAAG